MTPDPTWLNWLQLDWSTAGKLTLAALLGGLFGLERDLHGHEAGLRTNIMIAVSSCLFTILSIEAFPIIGSGTRDTARVAAQIVTGVGFLGAGTVLQAKNKIRGLTTAATIWLVAAVGMAAGTGAYGSAVFTTLLALGALVLLAPVSKALGQRARQQQSSKEKRPSDDATRHWEEETE